MPRTPATASAPATSAPPPATSAASPVTSATVPAASTGTARRDRPDEVPWWATAVTYQLYVRSFADGNGDGLGDLAGIRTRLPYIADLGVDAVWINPCYPSPQADGGYDVSDYRDIDPAFGTLDDARAVIAEAHALGLRVLLDMVPNHTSDEHAWFSAALAAGAGSAERGRYIFRPGRGPAGDLPPNDWRSVFGGPAWERVRKPDGRPGEWYLHLFHRKQPDLDWTNPQVRAEFLDILRFWFDLGADGFRIDVAHGLAKDPALPDLGVDEEAILGTPDRDDHPHWDRPEVHEIYRDWRALADGYDPPKVFVGEAWVTSAERLARYLRPGELHTAFDFDFVRAAWRAAQLRRTISSSLEANRAVGAPVTWVLSNHDITRHVTRFGHPQPDRSRNPLRRDGNGATDPELGRRRARAALLLELALPGGVYLYQGEELGLEEVEDLPEDVLQDPAWEHSGHTERGRDGCRVPLPWSDAGPSLGFGQAAPWLPQPAHWAGLSVRRQEQDRASMLWLYRDALRLRRELLAGGLPPVLDWLDLGENVVAFARGVGFTCAVNLAPTPLALPVGRVLLSSLPLGTDHLLPTDAAVWLATT